MTKQELRERCTQVVKKSLEHPELSDGEVSIVLLNRRWTKQRRMKLYPEKGSPWGEPIQELPNGTLCMFKAQEVLNFLDCGNM